MRSQKEITLFILFLYLTISLNAQITFQKTIGGEGWSYVTDLHQTTDGGYIVAGTYTSAVSWPDQYTFLIRTNAFGDTLWSRMFSSNGVSDEHHQTVWETSDGGFVLAGNKIDSTGHKYFMIRTNSNGDTLWTKIFKGIFTDTNGYTTIMQTSDEGFISTGSQLDTTGNAYDAFIVHLDSIGDTLWTKAYAGTWFDFGTAVRQTRDGGYILGGYTSSSGAGGFDFFLIKTDAIGDTLWSKTYGGVDDDFAYCIRQTADGGYIIIGGYINMYLIKTDSMGVLQWSRNYFAIRGFDVKQTFDGGYILVGAISIISTNDIDLYLIKTDANGDTIWTKSFGKGGYDYGYSVEQTTDSGYLIGGSLGRFGQNFVYGYLIKTDAFGNSGCWQSTPITFPVSSAQFFENNITFNVSSANLTIDNSPIAMIHTDSVISLCSSMNLNEFEFPVELIISPNPATHQFTISIEKIAIREIAIFNMMGERIYASNVLSDGQLTVNCKYFISGIYFIKLQTSQGGLIQKLVIE